MTSNRRLSGRNGGLRALAIACFMLLNMASARAGAIIHVKHDAAGTSDGTSWANAHPGLQSALARAQSGDEIWVAAGTYKPGARRSNSFAMKDGVALYGGFAGKETTRTGRNFADNVTILSGDLGTTRSVCIIKGADGILDGFTITGAHGDGYAGGMENIDAEPTVSNCIFDGANRPCGVYSGNSKPTFRNCTFMRQNGVGLLGGTAIDCTFTSNTRGMEGTAIHCLFTGNANDTYAAGFYGDTATSCTFIGNSSGNGAAVRNSTVVGCTFIGNHSKGSGGAIYYGTAINCVFIGNSSEWAGGAIYHTNATDCTFTSNTAVRYGGAMCEGNATNCTFIRNATTATTPDLGFGGGIYRGTATNCSFIANAARFGGGLGNATPSNCTFTSNTAYQGGAMYCRNYSYSGIRFINCTMTRNSAAYGGGFYLTSDTQSVSALVNCIAWDNRATTGAQVALSESAAGLLIQNCAIEGCGGSGAGWNQSVGTDKGGNIAADPQFFDIDKPEGADGTWRTADDGLRLKNGSPCINTGNLTYATTKDILGNPRVSHMPDIGAYENQMELPMQQLAAYYGSTEIYTDKWINLGMTNMGTSFSKQFVIKNVGTADLITSGATIDAPFQVTTAPAARIRPGGSSLMVVSLSTDTSGTWRRNLSLKTNDPAVPNFAPGLHVLITVPGMRVLYGSDRIGAGDTVRLRTGARGEPAQKAYLTIENYGNGLLTIAPPTLAAPFRIVSPPAAMVSFSGRTNMVIALDTTSTGTFTQTVRLVTNDPRLPGYAFTASGTVRAQRDVLRVKAGSEATTATPGVGQTWATAYPDLQMALAAARPGDEIWVAAGTYKPTRGTDRTASFVMREDVALYGGFAGTESSLSQRKSAAHPTILSGNIGTTDSADNSYHVVMGARLGALDGFTISEGCANDESAGFGAGMLNVNASPAIANCTFSANTTSKPNSDARGGAIYNQNSSPSILNCVFVGNKARGGKDAHDGYGGAIYNDPSSVTNLVNCAFKGNFSYGGITTTGTGGDAFGGAMYDFAGSAIVNSTFVNNYCDAGYRVDDRGRKISGTDGLEYGHALLASGGLRIIVNSIFWRNGTKTQNYISYPSCGITRYNNANINYMNCDLCFSGGSSYQWDSALGEDDGGNIDEDPWFVGDTYGAAGKDGVWRTADDEFALRPISPCINRGTKVSTPGTDITGRARVGPTDIGAYEAASWNAADAWALYR